jgi:erythromycin esterase
MVANTLGLTETQILLVNQLNDVIQPIDNPPPGLQDNQLTVLDYLRNARIVALGEATRNTKEFFQMKHRLFKYLVETHGFKAFGFETDFAESLYIDRYITTGEGDLRELMKTTMHFWIWKTEEILELFQWMKEYNMGKPKSRMIRYIGIDCQFTTYQDEWIYEYLKRVSPHYLEEIRPLVDRVTGMDKEDYIYMSQIQWDELSEQLQYLYHDISLKESEFAAISGHEQFKFFLQMVRNLNQAHTVLRHKYTDNFDSHDRDAFMAENALWLANVWGNDEKIMLWAHNAHIAENPNFGHNGSMGFHLKNKLGTDYRKVGFSFSKGSFNAFRKDSFLSELGEPGRFTVTESPVEDSINFIFHYAQYDQFIFVLKDTWKNSRLNNWLSESQAFLSIGADFTGNHDNHYNKLVLTRAFDVIIHFDDTGEANLLD